MKYTLLLILALSFNHLTAQNFPAKPEMSALVHDFANLFSQKQEAKLAKIQQKFDQKTGIQFQTVSVNSMHGMDPNIYSYRLAERWQIDQSEKKVLIVIKPKYQNERGEIFIATSFGGLDKMINDLTVKEIIETEIIPYYKTNQLFRGTKKGMKKLMKEFMVLVNKN